MLGVMLDQGSIGEDVNYSPLCDELSQYQAYDGTDQEKLVERMGSAEVVITNKVFLGKEVLEQAPSLKLVCIAATGTNNVDLSAARDQGISVCNVTDYATPSVVEHTFTLMLSLMRSLDGYQTDVRHGAWQKSRHFCLLGYPIAELSGKKLGIIGYGELGKAVASVAKAFGMEVLIAESLQKSKTQQVGRVNLDEMLATADVVSLHCPLTPETQGLMNKQKLSLMKSSAILINTARGGIVDEDALYDALMNKDIGGAGLDVLMNEPPREGNKLLTLMLSNLIITPHIAWASRESRQRLVNEIAANIRAFKNNKPRNLV